MKITKNTSLEVCTNLGKNCKRQNNCCRHGTGFLVGDDKKKIADFLKITEKELEERYLEVQEMFNKKMQRPKIKGDKPYGECVFFDNGCTIHKVKPLQCKVGTCSEHGEDLSAWFLVNYIVDTNDAESIRQYHTYLKSGGKQLEGATLLDLVPDKKKLKKILNYEILR